MRARKSEPILSRKGGLLREQRRRGRHEPRQAGIASIARASWLLPHEFLFCLFYLTILVRLALAPELHLDYIASYAAYFALAVFFVVWCRKKETDIRWRLRLFYYSLVMLAVYFQLGHVAAALRAPLYDAQLQAVDRFLVGGDLSIRMQTLIHPLVTEVLSASYMFFMLYLAFGQLAYLLGRRLDWAIRFYVGLYTVYGIGFMGYSLVSARGPYVALASQFHVPLEGWVFTRLNDHMVHFGSNGVDVFPSLHIAVPVFVLLFDLIHRRRRFWICLLPVLLLCCSTIYLRYHYFVDVAAGLCLALLALWLACEWPVGGIGSGEAESP